MPVNIAVDRSLYFKQRIRSEKETLSRNLAVTMAYIEWKRLIRTV